MQLCTEPLRLPRFKEYSQASRSGLWGLRLLSSGGVVTALCSMLPIIGTTLVFLPAICMLVFSGHWIKGLLLLVWAIAIVHPVDNVLRPYLIGERVKLSTLYVFFALLGGLKAFGALGCLYRPSDSRRDGCAIRFSQRGEACGQLEPSRTCRPICVAAKATVGNTHLT